MGKSIKEVAVENMHKRMHAVADTVALQGRAPEKKQTGTEWRVQGC